MMDIKEIYAKNLKSALRKAGMTQKELAEKIKTPVTTISGWMACRTFPHAETLQAVAEALGTTPAALLSGESAAAEISEADRYLIAAIKSSPERKKCVDLCVNAPAEALMDLIISISKTLDRH